MVKEMTKILLVGINGKMGQVICRMAQDNQAVTISCGVDINTKENNGVPVYDSLSNVKEDADVIIDFSHPSSLAGTLAYAKENNKPVVIATTGLDNEQIALLKETSKSVPVFFSANMSLGINLLIQLAKKAATLLYQNFDIEIIEKHHNQKIDAPSGTALAIADAINESLPSQNDYVYDRHSSRKKRSKNEIGLHAVRGGTIVGEHEVIFAGNDEIIEIKHTAMSKEIFAVGAIRAAQFICGKDAGMYDMNNLING